MAVTCMEIVWNWPFPDAFFFQKHDGRRIGVTFFVAVSPSRHAPDTNATTNIQYITAKQM